MHQLLISAIVATLGSGPQGTNCVKQITKIVLTGGPSSGKSSVVEGLKGMSTIVVVPEVAGIVISGGFPIPKTEEQVRVFQRVMPPLQKQLEEMYGLQNTSAKLMVLDRATLDGYGYWPWDEASFLKEVNLSVAEEMRDYNWVIFFEMPEEKYFGTNNPNRFHNYAQSVVIGQRQRHIWSSHPNFLVIPAVSDFATKVRIATEVIRKIEAGERKADIELFIRSASAH